MRVVIQRVRKANVEIEGEVFSEIENGFVILLGIEAADSEEDGTWLAKKISTLRIFSDRNGKMNLSLNDVGGDVLVISQFTLHAKTKKGTRPSFIHAAHPDQAIPLYEKFKVQLQTELNGLVKAGKFGADMMINLSNDGPVTIMIDTKNKE